MTDVAARFWAKVEKTETCWLWTAALVKGYARFHDANLRPVGAHRWAYEELVGPIPKGLTLDHLCRVRHCVNPDHLEPVTQRENIARIPPKTHCPHGHALTPANTYVRKPKAEGLRPSRQCRECARLAANARYRARRESA